MAIAGHITAAIDGADELLEQIDRGAGARELALAKTKLEEAELWLGRSEQLAEQKVPSATSD